MLQLLLKASIKYIDLSLSNPSNEWIASSFLSKHLTYYFKRTRGFSLSIRNYDRTLDLVVGKRLPEVQLRIRSWNCEEFYEHSTGL